jgi:hypothetical protein
MNWYYVEQGQQCGPVDDTQLEALRTTGRIQSETLIWCEGMANWQAYGEVKPAPLRLAGAPPVAVADAPPVVLASGEVACSECGRYFPPSEVIAYGDRRVCAACKPVFLQRLSEGAALPGGTLPGTLSEAELLARDYEVDIGGCLSRGWEVFKGNALLMIGVSLLIYVTLMGASLILGMIGAIVPGANLLSILLSAPLTAGLWLFYIRKNRNLDAGVSDGFAGFGPRYWQLVLTTLIQGLIIGASFLVVFVPAMALGLASGMASRSSSGPPVVLLVLMGVGFLVVLPIVCYLSTCWMFALPLVADKGLKFWPAMNLSRRIVNKHWWMTFLLLFVNGLIMICGVFALCLGLLVSMPVGFAAIVAHYEKVFGDLSEQRG